MGLFRKKKSVDPLAEQAVADLMAGKDVHEDSPFYRKMDPEEGAQVELMFGRAGQSVALYVLQRGTDPVATEAEKLTLAAKAMFATNSAKAEFHLRCQQSDRTQVEAWFVSTCEANWTAFLEKNPAAAGLSLDQQALIAEARGLIDRNWEHVMTMATAYAAQSVDVEGREFEFLDKIYYEPESTAT